MFAYKSHGIKTTRRGEKIQEKEKINRLCLKTNIYASVSTFTLLLLHVIDDPSRKMARVTLVLPG